MIFNSKVISIKNINNIVYSIHFLPKNNIYFRAGQYLKIIINKYVKYPFSIVSIPSKNNIIEIHIGISSNNNNLKKIIEYIYSKKYIDIDLPYGYAWFRQGSHKPIILIAGGTGFSYTYAILRAAIKENPKRNIIFYWGVQQFDYFYNLKNLQNFIIQYSNIKFILVIEKPNSLWCGRTGTVLNVMLDDFTCLNDYELYIAGPFTMIKNAKKYFFERGIKKEYLYGDAFEFI